MSADVKRNPALVVILSILGVLAVTLTAGLLLFQQRDVPGEPIGTVLAGRDEGTVSDEFDPISWAREGAEYPPLQIPEEPDGSFVADLTGTGVLPAEEPAEPVVKIQPAAVVVQPKPVVPAEPEYREVRENAYWVQVIASTSMSRAEMIREDLAARGMPAHVMTQDTGSETVYRVRLGAFETKDEAELFAGKVKQIAGFGDSYVTLAPVTRRVPAGG